MQSRSTTTWSRPTACGTSVSSIIRSTTCASRRYGRRALLLWNNPHRADFATLQNLYIDCATSESLVFLRDVVLPYRSVHVRYILFRVCAWNLRRYDEAIPERTPKSHEEYDEAARAELLVDILKLCPNLRSLNFDTCQQEVHMTPEPTPWFETPAMTTLLPYIQQQTHLTDLLIAPPAASLPLFDAQVVDIIRDMPLVREFTGTYVHFDPTVSLVSPLGQHLASLPGLLRLDLTACACVDSFWARLDWRGPLRLLALQQAELLKADGLRALVHKFAPTLRTLVLHDMPCLEPSLSPALDEPYVLPELQQLEVEGQVRHSFLRSFSKCPKLDYLELGDSLPVEKLVAIVKEGVLPKLKELKIMETMEVTERERETLEGVCKAKGIELETGTPA